MQLCCHVREERCEWYSSSQKEGRAKQVRESMVTLLGYGEVLVEIFHGVMESGPARASVKKCLERKYEAKEKGLHTVMDIIS